VWSLSIEQLGQKAKLLSLPRAKGSGAQTVNAHGRFDFQSSSTCRPLRAALGPAMPCAGPPPAPERRWQGSGRATADDLRSGVSQPLWQGIVVKVPPGACISSAVASLQPASITRVGPSKKQVLFLHLLFYPRPRPCGPALKKSFGRAGIALDRAGRAWETERRYERYNRNNSNLER